MCQNVRRAISENRDLWHEGSRFMLGFTWGIDEFVLIMKSLRSLRTRYDNFIENISHRRFWYIIRSATVVEDGARMRGIININDSNKYLLHDKLYQAVCRK